MKININLDPTKFSKIGKTKIFDLGNVSTTIDDLLNESEITITDNTIPILQIDGEKYLMPDLNIDYHNLFKRNVLTILESDLINLGGLSSSVRPYKVYTATLTQEGLNNPVATVLENTFEENFVWERIFPGTYQVSINGAFPSNKTAVFINASYDSGVNTLNSIFRSDDNTILVTAATISDSILADDLIVESVLVEIRVYN